MKEVFLIVSLLSGASSTMQGTLENVSLQSMAQCIRLGSERYKSLAALVDSPQHRLGRVYFDVRCVPLDERQPIIIDANIANMAK